MSDLVELSERVLETYVGYDYMEFDKKEDYEIVQWYEGHGGDELKRSTQIFDNVLRQRRGLVVRMISGSVTRIDYGEPDNILMLALRYGSVELMANIIKVLGVPRAFVELFKAHDKMAPLDSLGKQVAACYVLMISLGKPGHPYSNLLGAMWVVSALFELGLESYIPRGFRPTIATRALASGEMMPNLYPRNQKILEYMRSFLPFDEDRLRRTPSFMPLNKLEINMERMASIISDYLRDALFSQLRKERKYANFFTQLGDNVVVMPWDAHPNEIRVLSEGIREIAKDHLATLGIEGKEAGFFGEMVASMRSNYVYNMLVFLAVVGRGRGVMTLFELPEKLLLNPATVKSLHDSIKSLEFYDPYNPPFNTDNMIFTATKQGEDGSSKLYVVFLRGLKVGEVLSDPRFYNKLVTSKWLPELDDKPFDVDVDRVDEEISRAIASLRQNEKLFRAINPLKHLEYERDRLLVEVGEEQERLKDLRREFNEIQRDAKRDAEAFKDALNQEQNETKRLNESLEAANYDLEKLQEKNSALKEENNEKDETIASLREKLDKLSKSRKDFADKKLKEELASTKTTLDNVRQSFAMLRENHVAVKRVNDEISSDLDKAEKRIRDLERGSTESERGLMNENNRLTTENAELKQKLAKLEDDTGAMSKEISDLMAGRFGLEKANRAAMDDIIKKNVELVRLNEELAEKLRQSEEQFNIVQTGMRDLIEIRDAVNRFEEAGDIQEIQRMVAESMEVDLAEDPIPKEPERPSEPVGVGKTIEVTAQVAGNPVVAIVHAPPPPRSDPLKPVVKRAKKTVEPKPVTNVEVIPREEADQTKSDLLEKRMTSRAIKAAPPKPVGKAAGNLDEPKSGTHIGVITQEEAAQMRANLLEERMVSQAPKPVAVEPEMKRAETLEKYVGPELQALGKAMGNVQAELGSYARKLPGNTGRVVPLYDEAAASFEEARDRTSHNRPVVAMAAGPNNSGKSYLLNQLSLFENVDDLGTSGLAEKERQKWQNMFPFRSSSGGGAALTVYATTVSYSERFSVTVVLRDVDDYNRSYSIYKNLLDSDRVDKDKSIPYEDCLGTLRGWVGGNPDANWSSFTVYEGEGNIFDNLKKTREWEEDFQEKVRQMPQTCWLFTLEIKGPFRYLHHHSMVLLDIPGLVEPDKMRLALSKNTIWNTVEVIFLTTSSRVMGEGDIRSITPAFNQVGVTYPSVIAVMNTFNLFEKGDTKEDLDKQCALFNEKLYEYINDPKAKWTDSELVANKNILQSISTMLFVSFKHMNEGKYPKDLVSKNQNEAITAGKVNIIKRRITNSWRAIVLTLSEMVLNAKQANELEMQKGLEDLILRMDDETKGTSLTTKNYPELRVVTPKRHKELDFAKDYPKDKNVDDVTVRYVTKVNDTTHVYTVNITADYELEIAHPEMYKNLNHKGKAPLFILAEKDGDAVNKIKDDMPKRDVFIISDNLDNFDNEWADKHGINVVKVSANGKDDFVIASMLFVKFIQETCNLRRSFFEDGGNEVKIFKEEDCRYSKGSIALSMDFMERVLSHEVETVSKTDPDDFDGDVIDSVIRAHMVKDAINPLTFAQWTFDILNNLDQIVRTGKLVDFPDKKKKTNLPQEILDYMLQYTRQFYYALPSKRVGELGILPVGGVDISRAVMLKDGVNYNFSKETGNGLRLFSQNLMNRVILVRDGAKPSSPEVIKARILKLAKGDHDYSKYVLYNIHYAK